MLTLLIDADILAYEFAAAAQRVYQFGEGEEGRVVAVDDMSDVIPLIVSKVEWMTASLFADDVIMCLTDPVNWRKTVLPTYKANRKDVAKPVLLPDIRSWLAEEYRVYQRPGLEGDDVMGILATHPKLVKGTKVIVSIDKDMKTIPATIYNPDKEEYRVVDEREADYWHLYQTLTGDPTDGYKGCPGIGPVKAQKILAQVGDPWAYVCLAYRNAGLTDEDALVQARVARICRHTDYDFKRKEVILWKPSA